MHSCLDLIPDNIQRVFVAYSGGLDSSVLLHLAIADPERRIIPWHINHGLLEEADAMESFCLEQARHLGLELRIDRLELGGSESNIEARARSQRYRLFAQKTHAGDCVLTAHHADDQAETFLLNALRGSGSAGLRGIAHRRMLGDTLLLRPLLRYSRAELESFAAEHEIDWFDDPSNQDLRFDRNYLRNQVMPLLQARWPRLQDAFATTCELQAETQCLLDEVAAVDFECSSRAETDGSATLALPDLLDLSPGRCRNLLRYWIAREKLAPIPQARLRELMQQLGARADAQPEISLPGYSFRVYDQRLFMVRDGATQELQPCYEFDQSERIRLEPLELDLPRQSIFDRIGAVDQAQALSLRFRQEGCENEDRHRLKRLFQKHRVPPWRRDSVAQVYLDGRLEGLLL